MCTYSPSLFLPLFPTASQYIPLRAWLYRDGFARFSNTRFTLSSIDDQCILESHLPIPYVPCPSRPLAGPERAPPSYNVLLRACRMPSFGLGTGGKTVKKAGLVPSLQSLQSCGARGSPSDQRKAAQLCSE